MLHGYNDRYAKKELTLLNRDTRKASSQGNTLADGRDAKVEVTLSMSRTTLADHGVIRDRETDNRGSRFVEDLKCLHAGLEVPQQILHITHILRITGSKASACRYILHSEIILCRNQCNALFPSCTSSLSRPDTVLSDRAPPYTCSLGCESSDGTILKIAKGS